MSSSDKEKDIRDWIIKNDPQGQEFLDRLDVAVEKMKRRAPFTPEQIRAMAEAEEACACPYCGRVVLCGPPCCSARVEQIEFENGDRYSSIRHAKHYVVFGKGLIAGSRRGQKMNKEYKVTSGNSTVAEGIPDKQIAENIFWGRVRHDGSRGDEVVLYRNDRIVLKQVARYR